MLTISKPLSAGQAQTYHRLEFTAAGQNYYRQGGTAEGEWQGQLVQQFGLAGAAVGAREFALLTEGKDPRTEEQLVRHREALEYENPNGAVTTSVEHRAGWDATFSAPKSVSLTALVGGDDRVREAHREAVTTALTELERYTQARLGGNNPGETTGRFLAAKFEHDTARPVGGYAAPQLHTHAVIFNMTERDNGRMQALQPKALFDSQSFATAVYQSELMHRVRALGYEVTAGRSGAPEIKGYSQEYLDASSLRSQQIREQLAKVGLEGPAAAQIAAHATRDNKALASPQQVLAAHRALADAFGNEASRVVAEARERAQAQVVAGQTTGQLREKSTHEYAREAVRYAKEHVYEREAVADRRTLLRDALRHGMGEIRLPEVQREFDRRRERGEFLQAANRVYDTDLKFTTPATLAAERANLAAIEAGRSAVAPIMTQDQARAQADSRAFLNPAQRAVIEEVLTSSDRIHGLQGLAGTGKTTTLEAIREGAELGGYVVEGFAPTSRAAAQLREAGVTADTLQSFLARSTQGRQAEDPASRHLYLLDESSLASTRQMQAFLQKLGPGDRVLVIGDIRQHQGVDAGRPFEQMQQAGMRTAQLDTILRQRDPALRKAVEHLAKGETREGVELLREQGRVTEINDAGERIRVIARDYAASPEKTLIVSPDNAGRREINQAVREELRSTGALAKEGREFTILVSRNEMTGAERAWAARYQTGDVLQYSKGSKALGIERGSYATVTAVDPQANRLTVRREDGASVTYDPSRLRGVTAYREQPREVAVGDRLQFTAPDRKLGVANRELGTVTALAPDALTLRLDGKGDRTVSFDPNRMRHFDYGYAVTSHSSQGATASRVLINIDTDAPRGLLNSRFAYVSVSRAANDARIYTNRADQLADRLATNVTKTVAIEYGSQADNRGASERRGFRQTMEAREHPISRAAELHYAVAKLATKDARMGVHLLEQQGRVIAEPDREQRLQAIARSFVAHPERTVAIASSPAERGELNRLIRAELQKAGIVDSNSRTIPVMVEQQFSRDRAANYEVGDSIYFRSGSQSQSTAVVVGVHAERNRLTVQRQDGELATYDPSQLTATKQSKVYREESREFAVGDRMRLTGPSRAEGLRAGDLGTVVPIHSNGVLQIRMDSGPVIEMNPVRPRPIDHGYAVSITDRVATGRLLVSLDRPSQLTAGSPLAKNLNRTDDAVFYVPARFAFYEPNTAEDLQKFMERAPNVIGNTESVLSPQQTPAQSQQLGRGLGF